MKKIIKCFSLLVLFIILSTTRVEAAKVTCDTLNTSKTYHYNLDKKGYSESIKVSITEKKNGYYSDYAVNITVNGKNVIKRTSKKHDSNPFLVMITDTSRKDNQLELLVIEEDCYQSIAHIYYYRYVRGKVELKQDLVELYRQYMPRGDIHRMEENIPLTVNGKGEIYAKACMYVENFDYQHFRLKLKLKKGKFTCDSSKTYNTLDEKRLLWFSDPKKTITAYTKRGGSKKSFKITKKSKDVKIVAIYYDSKKDVTFLKVRNGKGKVGWVDVKKASTKLNGTYHVG